VGRSVVDQNGADLNVVDRSVVDRSGVDRSVVDRSVVGRSVVDRSVVGGARRISVDRQDVADGNREVQICSAARICGAARNGLADVAGARVERRCVPLPHGRGSEAVRTVAVKSAAVRRGAVGEGAEAPVRARGLLLAVI
jgi:hypothetical protein